MSLVIGQFRGTVSGPIVVRETPVYEWDTTTTPSTEYQRYEDTTVVQYLKRITATKNEACYDTWANRASTTKWRPINYSG